MHEPTVSVIIPTHNRAALLPRAIDSVVAQTFADWELLVVDDGSTDDTRSTLATYAPTLGHKLRVLDQPHVGACAARNHGINEARGRFVAFLDSDDEFLPTKLERQLRLFGLCPDLGFVYSDCAYVDLAGQHHDSTFNDLSPRAHRVRTIEVAPGLFLCDDLFDHLVQEYFICTIVGMVRREVLRGDLRFTIDPAYAEEWLFYLKVCQRARAGFVAESLSLHHHTRGSSARTSSHANLQRRRRLLFAMRDELVDLQSAHRLAIRNQIAQTALQLAYDHYRDANYRQARRMFWESLRHQPRTRTLVNYAQAAARSLRPIAHRSVAGAPAESTMVAP